ncbi:MAG: RNA ligase family protein [Deltaproteobacteria bacterium]|nr:RNA ligase family protein [Deltaproteobacteria bacterium]
MTAIRKYPRTHHLEGSRLQPGDEDLDAVAFESIRGRFVVVEEKIDGANAAVSFTPGGELLLQSRGHYLAGGYRERHFELLKSWAAAHRAALHAALGSRYVLYGEWVYAKHTIFYDALPHHLLEFDVLDTERGVFLGTAERRTLLADAPVQSVPVLAASVVRSIGEITDRLGRSVFKTTAWRERLLEQAARHGLDVERARRETDPSDEGEGLYLKVEEDGVVAARAKYVRSSFLTTVLDSGSHWLSRPILPNVLADGVDLFAQRGANP